MRKYVFGLGSLQVAITVLIIAAVVMYLMDDPDQAIIIAGALALSSTAIVLQVIAETRSQSTQVGRIALAVLLLQDFAVVPLLVIVPLLAGDKSTIATALGTAFVKAIVALVGIFITGRLVLRPLFSLISDSNSAKSNELFIAATLLIAITAAWGTEQLGLSLALGAFVAGILVAETEFHTQAEESIAPFKGLLLGLFFMTVGMKVDVKEIYHSLDVILALSFGLIIVKTLIISGLCILFGFRKSVAIHAGLLLSQGGEFAFFLFNHGMSYKLISEDTGRILLFVVTFTMALTPLLSSIGNKIAEKLDDSDEQSPLDAIELGARDLSNHVVIAGFGMVGRMVARMLKAENINYIALDISDKVVKEETLHGFPVFKGDVAQVPMLYAAGVDRASTIILAISNKVTTKKALRTISTHFPEVAIIVRSYDLKNASELYEAGATMLVPENYEAGLQLGGAVLKSIGINELEISRIKNRFRAGNYIIAKEDDDLEAEA